MRQYVILYKRTGMQEVTPLYPHVNAALYDKPQVNAAVSHMRDNAEVEGMVVRLGDEQFQLVQTDREVLATNGFEFPATSEKMANIVAFVDEADEKLAS